MYLWKWLEFVPTGHIPNVLAKSYTPWLKNQYLMSTLSETAWKFCFEGDDQGKGIRGHSRILKWTQRFECRTEPRPSRPNPLKRQERPNVDIFHELR